jgi:2-polyprenyl-3-methyl-5-hydroxy-6-metoxy-1,4-benzoquinol methylase
MRTADITGMTYNPLSGSYRLTKRDVDVNYLVTCRPGGAGSATSHPANPGP